MNRAKIAIIGGTGLDALIKGSFKTRIGTPYGPSPTITLGKLGGRDVAFLPRHNERHSVPPHKINYQANIWSLHELGVERILATNAVGAINPSFGSGDVVVPHDLVDFTKLRAVTFYDETPVTHIDVTEPYCPEVRGVLIQAADRVVGKVFDRAVYVCTEGPRYETPAEIQMFRTLGFDVVGMTGAPEAFLARELEICYATACFVSNRAAGMQQRLSTEEVVEVGMRMVPVIRQILKEAVLNLPERRGCLCSHALEGART